MKVLNLNTKHKRKSATITAILMLLLLLLIFFFGLKYMDPPIESGIAVNFGTSNVGSGNIQPLEPIKTQPNPQVTEEETAQEEVVEETVEEPTPDDVPSEDVATQESEESIRIKNEKEVKRKAKAEADRKANEKAEAERKAKAEAARIKKEQEDKKRKLDELMGGLNTSDGTTTGGQGNDNVGGDKGNENGDPNSDGYYGNAGSGGGGDYQLGNRKALSRPKPKYECEEEGLVIVAIEVDRNGKVIKATPGVKGSTNTAACLLSQAKIAAMKTTWQADSNAGSKQIGIIKYRFSLSN
ncbi:MAG: energy transducer TonB [Flavobacteriaceae bacterium]|nr:energy transducer TonB [Flavobacteriaceae bacterium]